MWDGGEASLEGLCQTETREAHVSLAYSELTLNLSTSRFGASQFKHAEQFSGPKDEI